MATDHMPALNMSLKDYCKIENLTPYSMASDSSIWHTPLYSQLGVEWG